MATHGLIIDHPGLPTVPDQRAALDDAQVGECTEIAPRTQEDWHYRIREALETFDADDTAVVSELCVLGLNAVSLLDSLEAVSASHVRFVSLGDGIDTAEDPRFLAHAKTISNALEAGRLAQARTIIDRAKHRDAVTPPKAEFVDRDLWEATPAETIED
ncbi:hypothetical protein [Pseudoclavibacter sp. CFCC 13611]|uniref:hypothetical protein n=1 Tax=Pseudoclavibacter sp. CFCC 13611 TaxID=2615178 RepID=UPI001301993C|nr:hypothetical protein [Pseudoclavibacter sp. CFCC 13611]KAB1662685.1 hypothetical protein F8O08_08890 [Pseudoclavibacter sp. CFCC 13611]